MSKYNDYAKRMNEIAKSTFAVYGAKADAVASAESRCKAYPRRNYADAAYMAKSARAEADLADAKAEFEQIRRTLFDAKRKEIKAIRDELEKAVADEFAADPKHIDMQTVELMRSGIMTANEYGRLLDDAAARGNHTMTRLIAQSAAERAEKMSDSDAAQGYRFVSQKGKGVDGHQYLETYDFLVRTFDRCERNFALSTKWDELTAPMVESF
jgi:hypothetical protein